MLSTVVECYSGVEYGERPRVFLFQGQRYQVAEVLGRWRTPEGRFFRVRTEDDQIFQLIENVLDETWTVQWIATDLSSRKVV